MVTVIVAAIAQKLLTACLAFLFIRICLGIFDRITGLDFNKWVKESSNAEKGLYISTRFFALCVLFGLIFS